MRKSKQLSVRVTEKEIARLRELAAHDEIRLSEFVRRNLTAIVANQPSGSGGFLRRITDAMTAGR